MWAIAALCAALVGFPALRPADNPQFFRLYIQLAVNDVHFDRAVFLRSNDESEARLSELVVTLGLRRSFLSPMGSAPSEERGDSGEGDAEAGQDQLPERKFSLALGDRVRGLRDAVRSTVHGETFPLVGRQALLATIFGFGFVWGGLWGALRIARWRDRRRAQKEDRG
jgi:hypothetical protein